MNLREQLEAIYVEVGKLTPETVLERARDEGHPLHDRFEWDDEVAGEAYRKQQAHELIQSVRIRYVLPDGRRDEVRAFHAVRGDDGYAYQPAEVVAADPMTREIVLRDMEREWRALHSRYAHFAEFTELVKATIERAA